MMYEACLGVDYLERLGLPFVNLSLESVRCCAGGRVSMEAWHEVFLRDKLDSFSPIGISLLQSPEEHYDQKRDKRSDIWRIGFLMYRFLTFKNPFGVNQWPQADGLNSLQMETLPPCYSMKLNNLVLRMLYKRAENRPTIGQIIAEIPLQVKLRYVKPAGGKDVREIAVKEENEAEEAGKRAARQNLNMQLVLKAPFRRLEVKPGSRDTTRTGKNRERSTFRRKTNLRPNTSSPPKRDIEISPSKTIVVDVSHVEANFFSKSQTRGSSRLSSRDTLNLSYERIAKRPFGSRPTIETLCRF